MAQPHKSQLEAFHGSREKDMIGKLCPPPLDPRDTTVSKTNKKKSWPAHCESLAFEELHVSRLDPQSHVKWILLPSPLRKTRSCSWMGGPSSEADRIPEPTILVTPSMCPSQSLPSIPFKREFQDSDIILCQGSSESLTRAGIKTVKFTNVSGGLCQLHSVH